MELNDQQIVAGTIGGFLLLGLGLGVTSMFGIQTFQIAGSQLCVSGIGETYIDSTASDYQDNTAWIVDTSVGNCNEKLVGTGVEVDNEDVEGFEDGEFVHAEENFDVAVTGFEAWHYNTIDTNPTPLGHPSRVYDPELHTIECDSGLTGTSCGDSDHNEAESLLKGSTYDEIIEDSSSLSSDRLHVITGENVAEIYDWSASTGTGFEADVTMAAQGRYDSATITKDNEQASLNVAGERASVQWTGSLLGEIRDVDYDDVIPIQQGNSLYAPHRSFADRHHNSWSNVSTCVEDEIIGTDREADDICHNYVDMNILDRDDTDTISLGFDGEVRLEEQENEIRAYAEDDTAMERPSLRIEADTELLGIFRTAPEPSIRGVSDFNIGTHNSMDVQMDVDNEGNEDGTIIVDVTCESGVSGESQSLEVAGGGVERFTIPVNSGGTPGDYECTAEAEAGGEPDVTDSETFTVTVIDDPDGPGNGDNGNGNGEVTPPPQDGMPVGLIAVIIGGVLALGAAVVYQDEIREVLP